MRRALIPIAMGFALAGCRTISSEDRQVATAYLENAAQYYDGGHYQRAYQQWEQALAMDSGNEKARFGQAMALYQLGRAESPKAIEPLAEATTRLDALAHENYGAEQWKVELGVALVHARWCEIYDRKVRLIAEQEKKGVPADQATLAIAKREFAGHLDTAEKSFHVVLSGAEKDPRDKLSCWLGLARIAAWRDDLPKSLEYSQLFLDQIVRSKHVWEKSAELYPKEAPIYQAKRTGAAMQEAELRDLMGSALFKLGRIDEAEAELNQVIAMFPQRGAAYLNRGILRQTRGDDDLARGDFKQFLNLSDLPDHDPSILEATRRLAEVQRKLEAEDQREGNAPAPALDPR